MRQYRRKGYIFKRKSEKKNQQLSERNRNTSLPNSEGSVSDFQGLPRSQEVGLEVAQLWFPFVNYQNCQLYCPNMLFCPPVFYWFVTSSIFSHFKTYIRYLIQWLSFIMGCFYPNHRRNILSFLPSFLTYGYS